MQFLTEWTTPDRKRLVVFAADAIKVFIKYRQRLPWHTEAGGILLGKRRGKHVEVICATEPMPTDKRLLFFFKREVDGHAAAAHRAWVAGSGTVDYVGEWHTHPQETPMPSVIDRDEWRKLMVGRSEHSPLVTVVVGTARLHVELLRQHSQTALVVLQTTL